MWYNWFFLSRLQSFFVNVILRYCLTEVLDKFLLTSTPISFFASVFFPYSVSKLRLDFIAPDEGDVFWMRASDSLNLFWMYAITHHSVLYRINHFVELRLGFCPDVSKCLHPIQSFLIATSTCHNNQTY